MSNKSLEDEDYEERMANGDYDCWDPDDNWGAKDNDDD